MKTNVIKTPELLAMENVQKQLNHKGVITSIKSTNSSSGERIHILEVIGKEVIFNNYRDIWMFLTGINTFYTPEEAAQ
jgi:hypothetical protein